MTRRRHDLPSRGGPAGADPIAERLDPGDLLLTGTPVGTALSAPAKPVELICLPAPAGDQVETLLPGTGHAIPNTCRTVTSSRRPMATDDGAIDLGRQRSVVRGAR